VIARVLTLTCGEATIKPDCEKGSAGLHIIHDPAACLYEWEKRGKVREVDDAVYHARIMAYMAGAEVEAELLGSTQGGDGDDQRQIAWMATELSCSDFRQRVEPRLRRMTRMLARRHQERIKRVAKALLGRTTLSREQLDKLVGRSVNDVKPNAPYLRAHHMEVKRG
jgi:hypothetical protein